MPRSTTTTRRTAARRCTSVTGGPIRAASCSPTRWRGSASTSPPRLRLVCVRGLGRRRGGALGGIAEEDADEGDREAGELDRGEAVAEQQIRLGGGERRCEEE